MRNLVILLLLAIPFHHALSQSRGDVLISEILFNPVPGGSDYVELYNASGDTVAVGNLRLAKMDDGTIAKLFSIADSGWILPHDYLVVTTDAAFVGANYVVRHLAKMVEAKSMPSYNDASGCVVVCKVDSTVLDRFDYHEKMHSSLLRDREGVALERRSFQAATQDASNWYSAATTAGFGTPTSANSQNHELLFLDGDLVVAVPILSPDGDGYNDLMDITYSLEHCDMTADVTIYDAAGHLVRHLLRGALIGCSGDIVWDGTSDNGTRSPRGKYVVVIEAYNVDGIKQNWRKTISLVRN